MNLVSTISPTSLTDGGVPTVGPRAASRGGGRPIACADAPARASVDPKATAEKALASAKQNQKLREATQEFEGLFIAQLLQSMRRTVPESGQMGGGDGERVFRDMLDQETAQLAAQSKGLGIGEMLYQQLARNVEGKESP